MVVLLYKKSILEKELKMEINLKIDGLSKIETMLNADVINKAVSRALNRAANSAITYGSKKIRSIYNIKAGDIKRSTKIRRATKNNTEAIIHISGGPIPFKYFGAKQTKKGVTLRIKKTEPRKLIKSAFIGGYLPIKQKGGKYIPVKLKSWGGGHVYQRKTKRWLPISKLVTQNVTFPQLFQSPEIWPDIKQKIEEVFQKEFWHNYEYYLTKK